MDDNDDLPRQFQLMMDRIRSNDPKFQELNIDCNHLGISIDDVTDSGILHYYIGLLCESLRTNTILETVSIDVDMMIQNLSRQTCKILCKMIGHLPNMQSLTLNCKGNNNVPIAMITCILDGTTKLSSLAIYRANLVIKKHSDVMKFNDAMQILCCSTLKQFRCFQVNFPASSSSLSSSSIIDDIIQSLPPFTSKLQDLRIANQHIRQQISTSSPTTVIVESSSLLLKKNNTTPEPEQHSESNESCESSSRSTRSSPQPQHSCLSSSSMMIISEATIQNLLQMKSLKNLSFNGIDFGNSHPSMMDTLATCLQQGNNNDNALETLNLCCSNIGDEDCIQLFQALQEREIPLMLKELHLASNSITEKSARSISNYLRSSSSTTLQVLNLSNNNINDLGCTILARSLCSNTTLKVLHLSYCNIGDDGIDALCCSLQNSNNTALKELYIKYNHRITSKGYQALLNFFTQDNNNNNNNITNSALENIVIDHQRQSRSRNNLKRSSRRRYNIMNKIEYYSKLNKSKIKQTLLEDDITITRYQWIKNMASIQEMMPQKIRTENDDDDATIHITNTVYYLIRSKPSLLPYISA